MNKSNIFYSLLLLILTAFVFITCDRLGGFDPSYTVVYLSNGGNGNMESSTHIYGINRNLNANTFTRENYDFSGWSDSSSGEVKYSEQQNVKNLTKTLGSTITLYAKWNYNGNGDPEKPEIAGMVWIPGGSFVMGKDLGSAATGDVTPVHTVTISGFYMGKYLVTQVQYEAIIGINPSHHQGSPYPPATGESSGNRPVESISWYDAVNFCNKLSIEEGLTPVYTISDIERPYWYITYAVVTMDRTKNGYRLPTEAEWEYVAKGGSGSLGSYTYSGSNNANDVAWYYTNSGGIIHEVGKKKANGFGIYDMSGNAYEWCWDFFDDYSGNEQTDPLGASSGSTRVYRGGGYDSSAVYIRSVYRTSFNPGGTHQSIGFRLVRLEQ